MVSITLKGSETDIFTIIMLHNEQQIFHFLLESFEK